MGFLLSVLVGLAGLLGLAVLLVGGALGWMFLHSHSAEDRKVGVMALCLTTVWVAGPAALAAWCASRGWTSATALTLGVWIVVSVVLVKLALGGIEAGSRP